MYTLDVKDRKILYQLDLDSRQSFRSIGRKVGLSKDTVISRVNRLEQAGVIDNYFTYIDTYKLGYTIFRCYFVFQYVSPEIEAEIINHFVNNSYSVNVNSLEGQYHFSAYFAVDDLPAFHGFWEATLHRYTDYFAEQVFSIFCGENMYSYSFLLDTTNQASDRTRIMRETVASQIKIDDIDFKLLESIASHPRTPTTELGKKLDVTAATIQKRMSRLQKLGLIKGFSMEIDLSKLGYQGCKLDIYLKNHKNKHQIAKYIINSPYIRSHYITPIGYPADLEFEICFMNVHHVHQLIEDLNHAFPDSIKTYRYHTSLKRYKNRYMPERIHG